MNPHSGNEAATTAGLLERFESLPFPIEVEIGTCEMSVQEVLEWKPGAILVTNGAVGAPLRLLAGGAGIAGVEVVLQQDSLSVRVRNILPAVRKNDAGSRQPEA